MPAARWIVRWLLTLIAVLLALVALLLLTVRVALTQVDALEPRVEALLEARSGAHAELQRLSVRLAGLDPLVEGGGLMVRTHAGPDALPLLEVEHARLRLATMASLRHGMPVVEEARLSGLTLHLYQDAQGGWHWPDPADIPPMLMDGDFDLEELDAWVGTLLRQRAWVEDLRLVLHGRDRRLELHAPRVLLTGDERRAHLEGRCTWKARRRHRCRRCWKSCPAPPGFATSARRCRPT